MAAGPCRWMASRRTFASSPSDRAPRRWWRSALARVRGGSERRLCPPLRSRSAPSWRASRSCLRTGQAQTRRLKNLPAHLGEDLARSASLGPILAPPRREPAPRAGVFTSSGEKAALLRRPAVRPLRRGPAGARRRLERAARDRRTPPVALARPRPRRRRAGRHPLADGGSAPRRADPRPRRSPFAVFACPGRPACAGATTDSHADAARLADAAHRVLAAGATVHVSGCPKGCAHPGSADLTLVGDDGAYQVVRGGSPRDAGSVRLPLDAILRRLSSMQAPQNLASAFEVSP